MYFNLIFNSYSSLLSFTIASQARGVALEFFGAPRQDYMVIFTPNATGALKLVGESYPFDEKGSFLLCADSHNSVNGISLRCGCMCNPSGAVAMLKAQED